MLLYYGLAIFKINYLKKTISNDKDRFDRNHMQSKCIIFCGGGRQPLRGLGLSGEESPDSTGREVLRLEDAADNIPRKGKCNRKQTVPCVKTYWDKGEKAG